MLTRPLNARHERRRRGLDTRREGPDDLVERVRLAQNRGAVARARRNHNAPARTVARGVHAVAGRPSQSDAVARRLVVPDAVIMQQSHGAPQWLRVRIGRACGTSTGDAGRTKIHNAESARRFQLAGNHPSVQGRARAAPQLLASMRLEGEESRKTLIEANNYAVSLSQLQRSREAKSLLRKTMPVARRVLGEGNRLRLKMRRLYARALYEDTEATLDDLREAVTTLEDAGRTAQRVLGGAHPTSVGIEERSQEARAALRARETPPAGDTAEGN